MKNITNESFNFHIPTQFHHALTCMSCPIKNLLFILCLIENIFICVCLSSEKQIGHIIIIIIIIILIEEYGNLIEEMML